MFEFDDAGQLRSDTPESAHVILKYHHKHYKEPRTEALKAAIYNAQFLRVSTSDEWSGSHTVTDNGDVIFLVARNGRAITFHPLYMYFVSATAEKIKFDMQRRHAHRSENAKLLTQGLAEIFLVSVSTFAQGFTSDPLTQEMVRRGERPGGLMASTDSTGTLQWTHIDRIEFRDPERVDRLIESVASLFPTKAHSRRVFREALRNITKGGSGIVEQAQAGGLRTSHEEIERARAAVATRGHKPLEAVASDLGITLEVLNRRRALAKKRPSDSPLFKPSDFP